MKKKIVHFEIGCPDIDQASAFYEAVFDWKLKKQGNAALIDTGEEDALSGHINQLGPEDPGNYVTVYIETDTLDADLAAIETNGGKIFVHPIQLADGRRFAWFEDVAGNKMGLITSE